MNKLFYILMGTLLLSGCSKQIRLEYINGYWEIDRVEKDGKILKQYNFNEFIEYFQVKDSIGFRMKLKPSFIGKFTGNLKQVPFKLKNTSEKKIEIDYQGTHLKSEFLTQASKNLIEISNQSGITYFYKKYTPITIE